MATPVSTADQRREAEENVDSILKEIYYSVGVSPLAYSQNAKAIAKRAKNMSSKPRLFTVDRVKQFLRRQLPTQFFKPKRVNFRRTVYFSPGVNRVWLCDCGYIQNLKKAKTDPGYFLLVYDIFSKMMYGRLIFSLKSKVVSEAFSQIIEQAGVKPEALGSDKGSEFQGIEWKNLMKKFDINHYFCQGSSNKAAPAERAIRTVKTLLYKMLDDSRQQSYKQLFQMCLWNINNRPNRALPKGLTPSEVNVSNESICYDYMFGRSWKKLSNHRFSFSLGQIVRIAKSATGSRLLYKSYLPADQWSKECYRITKRFGTRPSTYRLSDWASAPMLNRWYSKEIQLVPEGTPPTPYLATKILRRRLQKSTGRPQLLVQLAQPGEKRYARWLDEGLVQLVPPADDVRVKVKPKKDTVVNTAPLAAVRRSSRKHKSINWRKVLTTRV